MDPMSWLQIIQSTNLLLKWAMTRPNYTSMWKPQLESSPIIVALLNVKAVSSRTTALHVSKDMCSKKVFALKLQSV